MKTRQLVHITGGATAVTLGPDSALEIIDRRMREGNEPEREKILQTAKTWFAKRKNQTELALQGTKLSFNISIQEKTER